VTCARCHDHKFDPISQKDYYALYGVFASSTEPEPPPLYEEPERTPQYADFEKELAARELKLADFLQGKFKEVTTGARTRVAEYLLAAHAQRDKPDTGEFMLLADGSDINPTMIVRWQAYLERARKARHPVWMPWHELAELPEKDFAAKAKEIVSRPADTARAIHPRIAEGFAAKPPATLAEAAKRYGELLQTPELRGVLDEPDAPPNVPRSLFNELSLLPDRPAQGELQKLRKAVEQWRVTGPGAPPRAMALTDAPTPVEPRVFLRGNPNNLGERVPRRFLEVLGGPDLKPFAHGSGRLELAEAIADPRNPLTARVLVNRVWQHHFGEGLVRTPGDFGTRGEPPTHPELLDWLAAEFVEQGWSIKHLHRIIVLSAVYQQASGNPPPSADARPSPPLRVAAERADPNNLLLSRFPRQRLEFEALRDALLAVSGRLDRKVGGSSVENLFGGTGRRTLYGYLDRLNVPVLWRAFDFPGPDASAAQRDQTTIPQQTLFLMNHPFVLDCARRVLTRPEIANEKDFTTRVERLYRLLLGRPPTADEIDLARRYLASGASWERYVHALLLTNEFVFVD
jgi:hypothetical protein